ncbi:MAG TPA: hypothetical protein VL970_06525 [Candidatus Acidoferrales bacterium]|nr:hypothetical protein [Candidatus Acidoferrales bacterium]
MVGGFVIIKSGLVWVGKPCSRMIKLFFRDHRPVIVLAGLLSLICRPVCGGTYLPLTGPPPLRFEVATIHAKAFSWVPSFSVKDAVSVGTNLPPEISAGLDKIAGTSPAIATKFNASVPSLPENLSTNSTAEMRPANDLLVVTPEMLVDYFKPGSDATNQTNVRVLAPVGFMPPPSATSPSSQAIYQSQ